MSYIASNSLIHRTTKYVRDIIKFEKILINIPCWVTHIKQLRPPESKGHSLAFRTLSEAYVALTRLPTLERSGRVSPTEHYALICLLWYTHNEIKLFIALCKFQVFFVRECTVNLK